MQEIYKSEARTGYKAFINGGCLNYEDEIGAYKIPLGRRTHHCLIKLEDNEQVTRSLEIDLLTGNVYYAVDNHTDTGLAYYYDMTMQKVWNNRILRLLQSIRNEDLKPTPEIRKAIRKLPCEDWAEILSILPGWQEAYDDRFDRLFLPYEPVQTISLSELPDRSDTDTGQPAGASEQESVAGHAQEDTLQEFFSKETELLIREKISGTKEKIREYHFRIIPRNDKTVLNYTNDNIGAEFFNEDEKYERILSDTEKAWIYRLAQTLHIANGYNPDIHRQLIRFLRRELEITE